jgi:hypothetical protein
LWAISHNYAGGSPNSLPAAALRDHANAAKAGADDLQAEWMLGQFFDNIDRRMTSRWHSYGAN